MLLETALMMEIQRTNPKVPAETAQKYTWWVMDQAQVREIDPWVFHAIIHIESRWSWWALRREQDGTCSIGLGQINAKCDSPKAKELRDPKANIEAVGEFLGHLKDRCHLRCDNLNWVVPYNAGNPQYIGWVRKRVGDEHARYPQPALPDLPPRMHLEELRRDETD
jgi:hypothetical protein